MAFSRLRARLHAQDPHCYYCGIVTDNSPRLGCGYRAKPNDATIEHLFSRLTGPLKGRNQVKNLVIACYECNHTRAQREDNAQTMAQKRERSTKGKARESWFKSWDREMDRFDRF